MCVKIYEKLKNYFCFQSFLIPLPLIRYVDAAQKMTNKTDKILDTTSLKIVDASTELFLLHGIKSVTMDDVAQSIGMSKRTIYEHFDNKRSLLMACLNRNYEQKVEQEQVMVASAGNIVEELYCLLQPSGVNHALEHKFSMDLKKYFPDIFRRLYVERYEHISSRLRARLQRGIDQGIILRDMNVDMAVYVIFETIRTLMSRNDTMTKNDFTIHELFSYSFISFFRGIATPKGVEMIDEMVSTINKNK